MTPSFIADVEGAFTINLVVTNTNQVESQPDTVVVTSPCDGRPVAKAGPDQAVTVLPSLVQLDGSQSSNPNRDPLTYRWSLVSKPAGSAAVLTNANTVSASFVPDAGGTFVVSLVVNDGRLDSDPSNITVVVSVSRQDMAIALLRDAIRIINGLNPPSVLGPPAKTYLTTRINEAINYINQGFDARAQRWLEAFVLPLMDGCTRIGRVDTNDTILTCPE